MKIVAYLLLLLWFLLVFISWDIWFKVTILINVARILYIPFRKDVL